MHSIRRTAVTLGFGLLISAGLAGRAHAQTPCGGVFPATRDATILEAFPTQMLGSNAQVGFGTYNGQGWALLAFNLTALPDGIAIHEARLELDINSADLIPWPVDLHRIVGGWNEGTVSWSTRPAIGPRLAGISSGNGGGETAALDVTALLNGWLVEGNRQPGLALLPGASGMQVLAESTEAGQGPRLVVSCVAPGGEFVADTLARNAGQSDALARLRLYSQRPVEIHLDQGAVRSATFLLPYGFPGEPPLQKARNFMAEYAGLLRLDDPSTEMQVIRHSPDGLSIFFRQVHNGIPVVPGELAVHTSDCCITGLSGDYVPDITTSPAPKIDAGRAAALAAAAAGVQAPPAAPQIPPRLRYVNPALAGGTDSATYLAWQVATPGAKSTDLFIDAVTGRAVFSKPASQDAFDLELYTGSGDVSQGASICWWPAPTDIQWFDENGVLPGASPSGEGYSAFGSMTTIWNFWKNSFGREGHNGRGGTERLYVHVNNNNAWYHPFCDIFEADNGQAGLEILAHEFTHGVIRFEADLLYQNESGALNESYADLFGILTDPADWALGPRVINDPTAGCGSGGPVVPPTSGGCQPETWSQKFPDCTVCDPNVNDMGWVHFNSGINNKAGSLIIAGGTNAGYQLMGLGHAKAARLFYNVITNRLTSNSNFQIARDMTVHEARLNPLFGMGDACTIQNAYASVGVGAGDADCDGIDDTVETDDDGDGVPDAIDNCPLVANGNRKDTDGDGLGDACDPDIDNDGVSNGTDNCPFVANPFQWDRSNNGTGNGMGDACDDTDGDGVVDEFDICWENYDPDQKNTNGNGLPDACNDNDDGDGNLDVNDRCPGRIDSNLDSDGDGIDNACDNCPTMVAVSPTDADDDDGDGLGNQCDPDDDADGVDDSIDNCPGHYNPSQSDFDFNGDGTGCDTFETQQLYEDITFWEFGRYVKFEPNFPLDIPLPICPDCLGVELPERFEIALDLSMPASFQAQVLDGDGRIVAQAMGLEPVKSLRFKPVSYGISRFDYGGLGLASGGPGKALTGHGPVAAIVRPDQTAYTLRLLPGPATPIGVPVDFQSAYQECVDADGDGFVGGGGACAASGTPDCNDADPAISPGAAESCDNVDNDCDGVLDDAAPPVGATEVDFQGPYLVWYPVPGATGYDIVTGSLDILGATSGDFAQATGSCAGRNVQATYTEPVTDLAVGEGVWFLVRGVNCGGTATYDEPMLMIPARDPEIEASPNRCVACPHVKCQEGAPMVDGCDPCVSLICAAHPECCTDAWSPACVDYVRTECNNVSCSGSQGSCSHALCAAGPALSAGCDVPPAPASCVTQICAVDPYCCNIAWDQQCVFEVSSVCGLGC